MKKLLVDVGVVLFFLIGVVAVHGEQPAPYVYLPDSSGPDQIDAQVQKIVLTVISVDNKYLVTEKGAFLLDADAAEDLLNNAYKLINKTAIIFFKPPVDNSESDVFPIVTDIQPTSSNASAAQLGFDISAIQKKGGENIISGLFRNFRSREDFIKTFSAEVKEGEARPEITVWILFETDSASVKDTESLRQMNEAGKAFESSELAPYRFQIVGHTDDTGGEEYNLSLSRARAKAVLDYLTNNFNVDSSKFDVIGLGEAYPAESNDTPEGRAKNRRVVFIRLD